MEDQRNTNKLKMKDIITLSIFNIAILVVMVIVKMVITMVATPAFNYLFYVGVMGLFCGPLYVVMSNKVPKTGTLFVTSIFCGLMMLAFGSAWFLLVMIGVGIICEIIMIGKDSYKKVSRNSIAYTVYWILYALGSSIPLFFFKEQYIKSLGDSYSKEGIDILIRFYGSIDMLFLIGIISGVLAFIGFHLGNKFFIKHIKKAKLA